ncbi:MAG: hypothetical protein ACW99Q_18045, partial [Candidatus Kariarchaeaceae archaeon]
IKFDYQFTNYTTYPDLAKFYYETAGSNLIKDGSWHTFSNTYQFDSSTANDFDIKFEISNGELELNNMEYNFTFLCLNNSDNTVLQQDFELYFNQEDELRVFRNYLGIDFLIYSSFNFTPSQDGLVYHNTYGRTNKLEIIYKILANNVWHSSIYSTNFAESGEKYFNVTQFMRDNRLTIFQDFAVEFVIIGNSTELTVNYVSLNCSTDIKYTGEFYRIIDNVMGTVSDWVSFNSSDISILDDLGDLPVNFSIEYKVIDFEENEGINSTYNNGYNYIIYSEEIPITLSDDNIDLNSDNNREIMFADTGQFNNVENLDVFINGFRYGTAYLDNGFYKVSFGTENSKDNLLTYSDSLLSNNTFSNINPQDQISWEIKDKNYFAVVKHVLLEDSIVITNPIALEYLKVFQIDHLYDRGFGLENYIEIKDVYYYDNNSKQKVSPFNEADYSISTEGLVEFPEVSFFHTLFENSSSVLDNEIYFEYYGSEFKKQFSLSNADGFFINFTMPAIYYEHTTIQQLKISFNDIIGNSFVKSLYDIDLRQYFLESVKSQYEVDIFGLGKMMTIPIYLSMDEISLLDPYNEFDFTKLKSISIIIEDSERWPGSFIQNVDDLTVLNLPYQRVGILDLKLYNLISDTMIVDENGFINSTIMFKAPGYHNYFAQSVFKIKRLNIEFTHLKAYVYNNEITQGNTVHVEYSDYLELNYRWNGSMSQVLLGDIIDIPITLKNASSGEVFAFSIARWITKYDIEAASGYVSRYYYSRFRVPHILTAYNVTFDSLGTQLFNITFTDNIQFILNVTQESLYDSDPIYLPENQYELEYGQTLSLEGIVRDNDEYVVEDKVYQYNYMEALDGQTTHKLDIISPLNDPNFINRDEFSIYYINNNLERLPLFSTLTGQKFKNIEILQPSDDKDPYISYVDNAWILNVYWNKDSLEFINYDTNLLISHKVMKGRAINPLSYDSSDSYGNSLHENLVEIPFARYDMITKEWITEEDFTYEFSVGKRLFSQDVQSSGSTIYGQKYTENGMIQTGVLSLQSIYVNKSYSNEFNLVNSSDYNWNI